MKFSSKLTSSWLGQLALRKLRTFSNVNLLKFTGENSQRDLQSAWGWMAEADDTHMLTETL
jgi:hypothetical protein